MKKFLYFILGCSIFAFYSEYFLKSDNTGNFFNQINETFIRGGTLGNVLSENGLIGISNESHDLAINDACATKNELKGFDFHEQFRLRAEIEAADISKVGLIVAVNYSELETKLSKEFSASPEDKYYSLIFKAPKDAKIYIKYLVSANKKAILKNAYIEGRFHRSQPIILNGKPVNSRYLTVNTRPYNSDSNTQLVMEGVFPEVTQYLEYGIDDSMYTGVFPGKKNKGYCSYEAKPYPNRLNHKEKTSIVPKVNIETDIENLHGAKGIIEHKEKKGLTWEKPASLSISGRKNLVRQSVGLRFHGGGPGRTKEIESYRVYARKRLGSSTIDAETLLENPSETDFKTIVLKYTFQVLRGSNFVEFNPFIHSLALDFANVIGALVPRHQLVDLSINDNHKGLYLAMDHLSDRTIRHWLGHPDFQLYTYKSYNPLEVSVPLFSVAEKILASKGESTFDQLKKHFSIENVFKTILLTAYLGDNDYCQGVELLTSNDSIMKITSINWDLDHAFFRLIDGEPKVSSELYGFWLISPKKSQHCVRQWMFAWTYLQSKIFRKQLRRALEELLANDLHPDNTKYLLNKYKNINQIYFDNHHDLAISDLESYIQQRPRELLKQLTNLEKKVMNINKSKLDW